MTPKRQIENDLQGIFHSRLDKSINKSDLTEAKPTLLQSIRLSWFQIITAAFLTEHSITSLGKK